MDHRESFGSAWRATEALVGPGALPQAVCDYCVQHDFADAAVITLMAQRQSRGMLGVTGPLGRVVDDLQFRLGEGPCFDAFDSRQPVLEPDLREPHQLRWPVFSAAAVAADIRAIFAFPMLVGSICIGVLDLAATSPGPLGQEVVADLQDAVVLAANAVLEAHAAVQSRELLSSESPSRLGVHQATGMVAVQIEDTMDAALARLRAHAFAGRRSLYDVAADVLARRLVFEP